MPMRKPPMGPGQGPEGVGRRGGNPAQGASQPQPQSTPAQFVPNVPPRPSPPLPYSLTFDQQAQSDDQSGNQSQGGFDIGAILKQLGGKRY